VLASARNFGRSVKSSGWCSSSSGSTPELDRDWVTGCCAVGLVFLPRFYSRFSRRESPDFSGTDSFSGVVPGRIPFGGVDHDGGAVQTRSLGPLSRRQDGRVREEYLGSSLAADFAVGVD
jgi:hypothetical protein